jgi:hypothetical protein
MKPLKTFAAAGALMMTTATAALANDAVETIRDFYAVADARPVDANALRRYFADEFTDHDGHHTGNHADAVVGLYGALATGAPDSTHQLAMVLPSGEDKAIVYWRYTGTNTDNLFGMPTQDPARAFDIAGIEIFTVKNGKITDMWHVEEIAKLVETLTGAQ